MKTIKTTIMACLLLTFLAGCIAPGVSKKTRERWAQEKLEKQKEITKHLQTRTNYCNANPQLTSAWLSWIHYGQLRRGLSAEEVKLAWVAPDSINKSVGSYGEHEQWVYRVEYEYSRYGSSYSLRDLDYIRANIGPPSLSNDYYLYFEDGILTSWQENEK